MNQGNLQVYTGDGKGKTTAAIGLAVRAVGAGLRVYIGQFMKNNTTGELDALRAFGDTITIEQYGTGDEIFAPDANTDAHAACAGLKTAQQVLKSGDYDLVILDEANVADYLGYFEPGALVALAKARPQHVELVTTGRYASSELIEAADLVTEMREVKHYYATGTPARRGIEF